MIIAYDDSVNSDIDQAYYDELSNSLRIEAVKCSACKQVGFKVHSYYLRQLKRELHKGQEDDRILIKRVICKSCRKTHAILPKSIIPYSHVSLSDTVEIIESSETDDNIKNKYWITMEDIRNIKRRFTLFWRQRLLSFDISISDDNLCELCFLNHRLQFMQIRCQPVMLIHITT